MKPIFLFCLVCWIWLALLCPGMAEELHYVGSEACKDCHEAQYNSFMTYSRKAHSFESIKKMENKLYPDEYKSCFECHTTGYGQKGGFVSETQTPALKQAGCEVCHGPGSRHVETEDPADIISEITIDHCITCHNKDRVNEFNFKPLIFGGAH